MKALKCLATLLAASLVAACAAVPEQSAGSGAAVGLTGSPTGAAPTPVAPGAVVVTGAAVNLNTQVDDSASRVSCRDMLKQGSNVIVTTCMTRADWQRFERREAREAEAIVRMLQGSPYR